MNLLIAAGGSASSGGFKWWLIPIFVAVAIASFAFQRYLKRRG